MTKQNAVTLRITKTLNIEVNLQRKINAIHFLAAKYGRRISHDKALAMANHFSDFEIERLHVALATCKVA